MFTQKKVSDMLLAQVFMNDDPESVHKSGNNTAESVKRFPKGSQQYPTAFGRVSML